MLDGYAIAVGSSLASKKVPVQPAWSAPQHRPLQAAIQPPVAIERCVLGLSIAAACRCGHLGRCVECRRLWSGEADLVFGRGTQDATTWPWPHDDLALGPRRRASRLNYPPDRRWQ